MKLSVSALYKVLGSTLTIACLSLTLSTKAYAENEKISDLQKQVESTAAAYDAAQKNYADIETKIQNNKKAIEDLQKQLPEQRENAAHAYRELYKFHQGDFNLITLLLSTKDFQQFLSMTVYLSSVQNKNSSLINDLVTSQKELLNRKDELISQEKEAKAKLDTAKNALVDAQKAREKAQKEAEEKAAREKKEAEAALARAKKEASKSTSTSFSTGSGESAPVKAPSNPSVSKIDWSSDKKAFVNKWAPRINSYLSGSPMAGYGEVFAEAAWDNGVDPRWSPAIATVESGKGRYTPRGGSHNAWGLTKYGGGFMSWNSWDAAIRHHVRYLGRMYGSTLTVSAAQIYCPPNWQAWYSTVLAEMESI